MIIKMNLDGTIEKTYGSRVFQKSNAVQEIALFAPFNNQSAIKIHFTLPDGSKYQGPMIITDLNVEGLNMWVYKIGHPITEIEGRVIISLEIRTYTQGREITTSAETYFNVERSAVEIEDLTPEDEFYLLANEALVKAMEATEGLIQVEKYLDDITKIELILDKPETQITENIIASANDLISIKGSIDESELIVAPEDQEIASWEKDGVSNEIIWEDGKPILVQRVSKIEDLNTTLEELNGLSLKQVFEEKNIFKLTGVVRADRESVITEDGIIKLTVSSFGTSNGLKFESHDFLTTNKYYYGIDLQMQHGGFESDYFLEIQGIRESRFFKEDFQNNQERQFNSLVFSPSTNVVSDTIEHLFYGEVWFYGLLILDLNEMGLADKTKEDIDEFYTMYKTIKNGEAATYVLDEPIIRPAKTLDLTGGVINPVIVSRSPDNVQYKISFKETLKPSRHEGIFDEIVNENGIFYVYDRLNSDGTLRSEPIKRLANIQEFDEEFIIEKNYSIYLSSDNDVLPSVTIVPTMHLAKEVKRVSDTMINLKEEINQEVDKRLEDFVDLITDENISHDYLNDDIVEKSRNLLDNRKIEYNTNIADDGSVVYDPSPSYATSPLISVTGGETVVYSRNGIAPESIRRVAAYDKTGNLIEYRSYPTNPYTVPDGARYIRIAFPYANLPNHQLEIGTEATPYVPYGYKLKALEFINTYDRPKDYMFDEIERVKNELLQMKSDLTFAFMTDTHTTLEGDTMYKFKILGELNKLGILNFSVLGGDNFDGAGSAPKEQVLEHMRKIVEYVKKEAQNEVVILQGNHDTNAYATTTDDNPNGLIFPWEWHNISCRHLENKAVFDEDNPHGGYFYMDFESVKIRTIFLNTSDYYQEDENGNLLLDANNKPPLDPMSVHIQQTQFDWFQNKALNFMDKGDDRHGWAVVIMSHAMINNVVGIELRVGSIIEEVLKAFMDGTSFSKTINRGTKHELVADCDFTEQGPMEFICAINGHRHLDRVTNFALLNRPNFDVTNMHNGIAQKITPFPEDGNIWEDERIDGTIGNEAFDIFTIDRKNRKIRTIRYGAGVNREVDY